MIHKTYTNKFTNKKYTEELHQAKDVKTLLTSNLSPLHLTVMEELKRRRIKTMMRMMMQKIQKALLCSCFDR